MNQEHYWTSILSMHEPFPWIQQKPKPQATQPSTTYKQKQIETQATKQEMEKERREMVQVAKMKEDLLLQVRKDKNSLSRQLTDLQNRAKRIDGLISNLETTRNREPAAPGTAGRRHAARLFPAFGFVRRRRSGSSRRRTTAGREVQRRRSR